MGQRKTKDRGAPLFDRPVPVITSGKDNSIVPRLPPVREPYSDRTLRDYWRPQSDIDAAKRTRDAIMGEKDD
jgi:hypothetical protein